MLGNGLALPFGPIGYYLIFFDKRGEHGQRRVEMKMQVEADAMRALIFKAEHVDALRGAHHQILLRVFHHFPDLQTGAEPFQGFEVKNGFELRLDGQALLFFLFRNRFLH